ncbi:family 10 glycosylhydrolase [Georgenia sp. SUBG003]|uniref:family 10 glycosylhydrolase n=1 Tax=Georgenia sp. SUBG003 TaxID=1497974 RepID=UPI003AB5746F
MSTRRSRRQRRIVLVLAVVVVLGLFLPLVLPLFTAGAAAVPVGAATAAGTGPGRGPVRRRRPRDGRAMTEVALAVQLRGLLDDLQPSTRRVAEFVLADPERAAGLTITGLADACGTSQSTIVRLCREVGLAGYRQFRLALVADLGRRQGESRPAELPGDIAEGDDLAAVVAKIAFADARAVEETGRALSVPALEAAVDAVVAAGRTDVYGVGASGIVAADLQQKLHRIGRVAFSYPDAHLALTSAALLRPGDVAIGISHTGTTIDTVDALAIARRNGATTVAITNAPPVAGGPGGRPRAAHRSPGDHLPLRRDRLPARPAHRRRLRVRRRRPADVRGEPARAGGHARRRPRPPAGAPPPHRHPLTDAAPPNIHRHPRGGRGTAREDPGGRCARRRVPSPARRIRGGGRRRRTTGVPSSPGAVRRRPHRPGGAGHESTDFTDDRRAGGHRTSSGARARRAGHRRPGRRRPGPAGAVARVLGRRLQPGHLRRRAGGRAGLRRRGAGRQRARGPGGTPVRLLLQRRALPAHRRLRRPRAVRPPRRGRRAGARRRHRGPRLGQRHDPVELRHPAPLARARVQRPRLRRRGRGPVAQQAGRRRGEGGQQLLHRPGEPARLDYVVDAVTSITENYDVDGINLDYIRYPDHNTGDFVNDWGYSEVSLARFAAETGRTDVPAPTDEQFSDWRRDQVSALVRKIYLEMYEVDPTDRLSVNGITYAFGPASYGGWEGTRPYRNVLQDWKGWLDEGIVDTVSAMNYKREWMPAQAQMFDEWNDALVAYRAGRHVVNGPALYLNDVESSVQQARDTLEAGFDGWMGYSYANATMAATASGDRAVKDAERAALTAALREDVLADDVAVPEMAWRTDATTGNVAGTVTLTDGTVADQVDVVLHPVSAPGAKVLVRTDGSGWFGAVGVAPGRYRVQVAEEGAEGTAATFVTVEAGTVASPAVRADSLG